MCGVDWDSNKCCQESVSRVGNQSTLEKTRGKEKGQARQKIPDTPSYRSASWQDNRDIKIISKLNRSMSFQGCIILCVVVVPEEA